MDAKINEVVADLYEQNDWPTIDSRGRGIRAVVDLVDPGNPERTKRLNSEQTADQAGLYYGAVLRVCSESAIVAPSKKEQKDLAEEAHVNFDPRTLAREIASHVASGMKNAVYPKYRVHPVFGAGSFQVKKDLCLILMPFNVPSLEAVYQDLISPAIERAGLKVIRADNIYSNSSIMEDIWKCINQARIIVADLTDRNPNVFYEVGISHTLGKEVIMLVQDMNDVPFDLRHLRAIVYEYTPRGCRELEKTIELTVKEILNKEKTDNG